LPLELLTLALDHRLHRAGCDREPCDRVAVEHLRVLLGDRADRELGMTGQPDLADTEHVERRTQGLRHLRRDRDATAREAENDDVLADARPYDRGEPPPRIRTVQESPRGHGTSLRPFASRAKGRTSFGRSALLRRP